VIGPPVQIGDRLVGPGRPCFVVAEAGVNHDGDLAAAKQLVRAAAEARADCVKFQLFKAEEVASAAAPKAAYQLETTDPGESQLAMLKRLELAEDALPELVDEARRAGLEFLCSCYSERELDLLADLGVPAFKFASAQIVELPFLSYAARQGKPILLATGMATLDEIEEAIATVRGQGDPSVVLLQCTTNYPAPLEDANLRAIATMAKRFGVPVGYSDHTLGDTAAIASVACGAVVLEKHLTLDRALPGPDHRSSLEPDEFEMLVRRVREVEAVLGSDRKEPAPSERANAERMRRSLFAAADIPAGTTITADHLVTRRPYIGLPPRLLPEVVGSTAKVDIPSDTPISLDLLTREP